MQITHYTSEENDFFDQFAETLVNSELTYGCMDLRKTGIIDEADMAIAISKSMQTLQQAGIFPHHHFRHIFVTNIQTGNTYNDWRMSKTGFLLVLMHSSCKSPTLTKWKIEMVQKSIV